MKVVIIIILSIVLFSSCNTTEPEDQFGLTLEDVSCTEAWMKVTGVSNYEFILERNNVRIYGYEVLDDNTIYDDSLKPNTSYSYRIINQDGISSKVTATTLDTTSHDFTWETYSFGGEGGSSYFEDVAIIDENNIWVVGIIYTADDTYNAVHWDGSKWELKQIYYYGDCSAVKYPELKAIYSFSKEEIVVTNGGSIGWFDSDSVKLDCGVNPLLSGAINAIWGSSSNDIYVVGNGGSIAHYDGSSWTKIESGTDLDIYDIWGDYNTEAGGYEILCVAAKMLHSLDRDIIEINNSSAELINEEPITQPLCGIWFKSARLYLAIGSGIYSKKTLNDAYWNNEHDQLTKYFTNGIDGTGLNDIMICGSYNELLHFNGNTWKSYRGLINDSSTGRLLQISLKNNMAIVIGQREAGAIIYKGNRN